MSLGDAAGQGEFQLREVSAGAPGAKQRRKGLLRVVPGGWCGGGMGHGRHSDAGRSGGQ